MTQRILWGGFAVFLLVAASTAAAQTPPDVVMTRDGGMMRGTILEHVPGSHVTLQTPSGEQRRIDGTWVTYAGPAAGAPGATGNPAATPGAPAGVPAPPTAPTEPRAQLQLESNVPGVTFHLNTGSATATAWGGGGWAVATALGYDRLCTAPCNTTIPLGVQRLGLSYGDGTVIPAPSFDIPTNGTLYGTYVDNDGIRIAGWLVMILGVGAGLGLMLYPLFDGNSITTDDYILPLAIGTGIAVAAGIVGPIMMFTSDGAQIRFE